MKNAFQDVFKLPFSFPNARVLLGEDLGKVARGAASRERGLYISEPCELIARALFLFLLSSGKLYKRVRNL